jgi:hypothetical protein
MDVFRQEIAKARAETEGNQTSEEFLQYLRELGLCLKNPEEARGLELIKIFDRYLVQLPTFRFDEVMGALDGLGLLIDRLRTEQVALALLKTIEATGKTLQTGSWLPALRYCEILRNRAILILEGLRRSR